MPSNPDLGPDLGSNVTATVKAAPGLKNDPGTVAAVGTSGGNVTQKAQAVNHGLNQQANDTAQAQNQKSGGFFSEVVHAGGAALHQVARVANVGLATAQQEYRYLHDVEARHGWQAALEEGAGIGVGAIGGGLLGTLVGDPLAGAAAGAVGVGRLEGQFFYKDSWKAAANPNYHDPHTGNLVSFGRDIASHLVSGAGHQSDLSGVIDGITDMAVDPLANAGKLYKGAHLFSATSEDVDRAMHSTFGGKFRRSVSDIAKTDDAGTIVRNYPQLKGIAHELALANSDEAVVKTFKDVLDAHEMGDPNHIPTHITETAKSFKNLPTLSASHVPFRALRDAAANAGEGPISHLPVVGPLAASLADNKLFGPRRWADRLSPLTGTTLTDSGAITGKVITSTNQMGYGDLYNLFRYGLSDRASKAGVTMFDAAEPAERQVIYKNLVLKTVMSMAGMKPDDLAAHPDLGNYLEELGKGDVLKEINERLENHLSAAQLDGSSPDRIFGMKNGQPIGKLANEEGVNSQAAITRNQAGDLSLPHFQEMKAMARAIRASKVSNVLAGADGFFYDHVTQGFFKPLELMSAAYALRIAMAEIIPNTLRHGVGHTVNTMYDMAVAGLGYKAEFLGKQGALGWLYHVAGERALRNNKDAQALMDYYALNGGFRATAGMVTGTNLGKETVRVERSLHGIRQKSSMDYETSPDFGKFGNEAPRFNENWHAELRENARDPWARTAAKAYRDNLARGMSEQQASEFARQKVASELRKEPQSVLDQFDRSRKKSEGSPDSWDPIDSWANEILNKVQGSVTGESGRVNQDLLGSLANGHIPQVKDLEGIDDRPLGVKGRRLVPASGNPVQKLANLGFRKMIEPIVDHMSRYREFAIEYTEAYDKIRPLVEQGRLNREDAVTRAAAQATTHGIRFVHNINDRTQWTETMRNWAPFYFAQEQAYRRMFRLLVEDPGAFRRYQLAIVGGHNIVANMQDSDGNRYMAIPGTGYFGKLTAEAFHMSGLSAGNVLPAQFGGSGTAVNVVFPFANGVMPSWNALITIPAAHASTLFTEFGQRYSQYRKPASSISSALQTVAGPAMDQDFIEQLIPNTAMRDTYEATLGDSRAFQSSMMQAIQLAVTQQGRAMDKWTKGGRQGPMPAIIPPPNANDTQIQGWLNKLRNMTRMLYFGRVIGAFSSPVGASVEIQNFNFPKALSEEIKKAGSVTQGMTNYLHDHPDGWAYMVSQSYNPSDVDHSAKSGITIPSTAPAEGWINQHMDFIQKNGNAALWFMPQLKDAKYDPTIYNEQLAQGLRVKRTPDQFMRAQYLAAGDNLYYDGLSAHEAAIAAAGQNKAAVQAEYDNWNTYVKQMTTHYPIWATEHFSEAAKVNRGEVIQKMTAIVNNGEAPPGEQTNDVTDLLNNYYQAAYAYKQAGDSHNYAHAQSQVQDQWIQYLDGIIQEKPNLKPFINTILKQALKPAN